MAVSRNRDLSMTFNGADQSCLQHFKEVIRQIQVDDLSHETAEKLKKQLQKMCEILSREIQKKKQRQQSLMVEINRKENNLKDKELQLKNVEREAKDAGENMNGAKSSMESRDRDKQNAENKLEKKREELKNAEVLAGVGAGLWVGVAVLSFGLGAGPAVAGTTASAAAIATLVACVKDFEKNVNTARELYRDACSVYNTARKNHSDAVDKKDAAERAVKEVGAEIKKLKRENDELQDEVYCLGDLLKRMKQAEVEINSTHTTTSALARTLRQNRHLPDHFQDKRSVISHCSELIAKFEVLAKMEVLSIGNGDLNSSRRCRQQLQSRGRQLRIQYEQAQSCLDDYC